MIFLHGLGGTARMQAEIFMKHSLCPKNCRIIFPNAPTGSMSCYKGNRLSRWFNMFNSIH